MSRIGLGRYGMLLCAFACACALGCEGTTGFVVSVRSDLRVPDELAAVRAMVSDASGTPVSLNDFVLDEPASVGLPFSFGIVPLRDPGTTIVLELVALDGARAVLFVRRTRTRFIEGRTLLLELFLASECRTTRCEGESTCTERGCDAPLIPPERLAEIDPSDDV